MVETGILRALKPKHILFLCVANSTRSQLAEGIARALAPTHIKISSAGSQPASVRPEVPTVLQEIGIDASRHLSKGFDDIDMDQVDAVITLCSDEVCPWFPQEIELTHTLWAFAGIEYQETSEVCSNVDRVSRRSSPVDNPQASVKMAPMRLTLVHDWLNQMGGAEDVLETMVSMYPQAPLYTSMY